jgi:predicted aldo/keto reductase-like oxidoreductase
MQYRPFGKLDFHVSALGFGAMRLPTIGDKVDEEKATEMFRYAVDRGVNYVDTAYPYHLGQSEQWLGKALKGGYREKVKVATKLPSWEVQSAADFDKFLDLQLARLGLEFVDFYLLHTLNKHSWPKLRDLGVLEWAKKTIGQGRFRHLAFSFHDDAGAFKTIVDEGDWSMCQIQYNYMDVENQAGMQGLKYAASKGLAVVVMEPLLGGKLVAPPPPVRSVWDGAERKRTPVAWALDWLWSQPEVSTVLSGMSSMEQVRENVELAESARVGALTAGELGLFESARKRYKALTVIPCTACRYCMPCPHGVDIPGNLANYNSGVMFGTPEASKGEYGWWKYAFEVQKIFDHDIRAAKCIQCGECEEKCPQSIPIASWMPVIHGALAENEPYLTELKPAKAT